MPGVERVTVTSNNYFSADYFSVVVAVGEPPLSAPSFWEGIPGVEVELQVSLDGLYYSSLLFGQVDTVLFNPLAGEVRIAGRDLSSLLIDSGVQESFSNRTSSEIVELLALGHGLSAGVTPTSTPVGRYYHDEHDRVGLDHYSRFMTEWDLLVFLARQEGFDLYLDGRAIQFHPMGFIGGVPVVVTPRDLIGLRLHRSAALAGDVEVTVRSWNSRRQSAFIQVVRATAVAGGAAVAPRRYSIVRPNLTPEQALGFAQRRVAELVRHERRVELEMPGDVELSARDSLAIQGTGTGFDQTYSIDSIERNLHPRSGFTQRVLASGCSPRSVTVVSAAAG